MPNDYSNFTMPETGSASGGYNQPGPAGDGDNGETWDPTTKRWVPRGQVPFQPVPPRPTGDGGWSSGSGNQISGTSPDEGTATLGKARAFDGSSRGSGAWGGYAGTFVDDGNGGARYDAGLNGRQEAVDHARGLGQAAANQQAYQIDYGQADQFARLGQQDRGTQLDALRMTRDAAKGLNLQSQALGQTMLQQGVQAQQAGAASTRGGSLAQAAAMRQQAAGQGAFMQQGNTMLQAQRAADMAQARDLYMQQTTGIRASDAQAQGLNQQQGIQQMQQETQQRGLNQQGQMGYEAQGQAVNKAAQDAALSSDEINHGIDSAASKRASALADKNQQMGGALAGAGGALIAKGAGAFDAPPTPPVGGGSGEARALDPYSQDVSNSDARGKTKITSLAAAALKRRGC